MRVSLDELKGHVERIPINQYFRLQVLNIGEGYCEAMMPFNPHLTNTWRNTHGGAYMTVTDMAFFLAAATMNGLDISGSTSTVEIKTNFLRPSRESDLFIEAQVIKNGRRHIFGDVRIRDSQSVRVAHSTVTYFKNG